VVIECRYGLDVGTHGPGALATNDFDAGSLKVDKDLRQERRRHRLMYQQVLGCVAYARPLDLGVEDYGVRHGEVGPSVDVDVAVPYTGLDDGYAGVLHDVPDEPCATARDDQVDAPVCTEQGGDQRSVRGSDELHGVGRQSSPRQGRTHAARQRLVACQGVG